MLNLKNTLDGYLKNVEVIGNTIQDENNLADIRSVGDKVEGQELYKIDVVSYGKNIFNPKIYENNSKYVYTNNEVNFGKTLQAYQPIRFIVKVRPNTDYVFSSTVPHVLTRQVATFNLPTDTPINVVSTTKGTGLVKFNSLNNNELIISLYSSTLIESGSDIIVSNFQLEEGTQATEYEPYQENKLEILSPVQLEKVGDVADRIICKDGVWGVEKCSKSVTVKGDETITIYQTRANVIVYRVAYADLKSEHSNNIISNKFIAKKDITGNHDVEGICVYTNDNIYVSINKSKLTTQDVKGFSTWLKENDLMVKYPVKQPQFIPLPHDQQVKLRTFAGQTNIAFLTEISGQIKAQVPKSLGATVNTHTEQIAELHNSLDRVKKLEETTVSTIETESSFTAVDATSNGYFEDVKLEGRTLVNLCPTINKQYNHINRAVSNSITIIGKVPSDNTHKITLQYLRRSDGTTIWTDLTTDGNGFFRRIEDIATIHQIYFNGSNPSDYSKYKFLILEGDHTNNPPSYFEGLMSVGQDVEEVSIESAWGRGNLFSEDVFVQGYISSPTTENSWSSHLKTDFLNVIPNCEYFGNNLNESQVYSVFLYDKNKLPLRTIHLHNYNNFSFATASDECYIRVTMLYNNLNKDDLYLSSNGHNTFIQKQDKKQILYYNPTTETWEKPVLREWDTIEKHSDGKYYYHKRSGEVYLHKLQDFFEANKDSDVYIFGSNTDINSFEGANIVCNNFTPNGSIYSTRDRGIIVGAGGRLRICMGEPMDLNGFKAWLNANPTTIVYQLAQEEVYECTNIDLMTYSGETNYKINSGAISPKSFLKVHNNISNVVKILQEKVSLLENVFISGLKSVLSGDMYSLATILYPEDFEQNDNTEQDIMVIPE